MFAAPASPDARTGCGNAGDVIFHKTVKPPTSLEQTGLNRTAHGEGCVAMSEPWLSAEEIAAHLGVTKDTVYAWIADKSMPAHKIGRLWKFQATEVDSWVRSGGTGGK
jgi:excisionase family DNA binding protein